MKAITSGISLRALGYLVALAEERHFGRAAESCFVSQPTLSAQIKKLEEQLGVQLVERSQRRVMLSDIGEQIVARARQVLQEVDAVCELARGYQDPFSGELRVGLIPTVGPYLLPVVSPTLRKALPELKLYLLEYQTGELLERLTSAMWISPSWRSRWKTVDWRSNGFTRNSSWPRCPPGIPCQARSSSASPTSMPRRCFCSRTGTACGIRHWKSVRGSTWTNPRTSGPPASKRSGRWSPPGWASRCSRRWRRRSPSTGCQDSWSGHSAARLRAAPSHACGGRRARGAARCGR